MDVPKHTSTIRWNLVFTFLPLSDCVFMKFSLKLNFLQIVEKTNFLIYKI